MQPDASPVGDTAPAMPAVCETCFRPKYTEADLARPVSTHAVFGMEQATLGTLIDESSGDYSGVTIFSRRPGRVRG